MGCFFEKQQCVDWELMGENQRQSHQRKPCGWCLLQTSPRGEDIDEALWLQLQEASHLQALILQGDFSHWKWSLKVSSNANHSVIPKQLSCASGGRRLSCSSADPTAEVWGKQWLSVIKAMSERVWRSCLIRYVTGTDFYSRVILRILCNM